MPTPSEYADAIEYMEKCIDALKPLAKSLAKTPAGERYEHLVGFDTLALRWLRVGAAMEARTVNGLSFNGVEWMAWRTGSPTPFIAPDPLTAAELAMGVGT